MKIEKTIWPEATLCFPIERDRILLSRKIIEEKVHKPGAGKLSGYGGGIEAGETLEEACVRELFEESGLSANPAHLELVAIIYFHNSKSNGETFICKVYVYLLREWRGQPGDGDKMKNPTWFSTLRMPWKDLTLGDRDWLPSVLAFKKIIAHVYYGPFQQKLLKPTEIMELSSFSEND